MIRGLFKRLYSFRRNRIVASYYDKMNALSSLSPDLFSTPPRAGNVLVLAPHCDDESIGCGGAILRHHLEGSHVTVVFMTDGSQCNHEGSVDEIIAIRKKEAEKAGETLGVNELVFLDNVDRQLRATPQTVDQISKVLSRTNPDIIYLPFYLDNHPDHRATASILTQAASSAPEAQACFYEIWTSMIPNLVLDISEVIDPKMKAIQVYQSQKNIGRLAEQIKSLNRFRALTLSPTFQYAESFFRLNTRDLKTFIRI